MRLEAHKSTVKKMQLLTDGVNAIPLLSRPFGVTKGKPHENGRSHVGSYTIIANILLWLCNSGIIDMKHWMFLYSESPTCVH